MGWSRPTSETATYGAAVAWVIGVQVFTILWPWSIEDSAISLGFATHIAEGWGPVPYPGGPPTEGYSNPLWVAVLVPGLWLGIAPYPLVRMLGLMASLGGIFATAAAARPTLGPRGAALASLAFAAFAPMNIWAQSGLENSLYNLLLALGAWRVQVDGRRSWAALCFLGLALTRPEAAGLAALGFGAAMVRATGRGAVGMRLHGWVTWALLPFLAYHALRYATFAAELPATAYAKVDDVARWDSFRSPTWLYLRRFATEAGFVVWLPAVFYGAAGSGHGASAERRRRVAGALSLLLAAGFLGRMAGVLPDDATWWLCAVGGSAALGLAVLAGKMRAFFGLAGAYVVLFSLLSGGDWMKGWRWFSLISVPVAYGLAAAAQQALGRAPHPMRSMLVAAVGLGFVAHQGIDIAWFADKPAVSPWSINRRVNHYRYLMDTLQLRRRPLVIDQDLGANVLWGSPHYDVRDAKGLTDLPFALHRPRPEAADALLVEDAFELPAFVHLHVVTKRTLQHRPWFKEQYVEVPGYPVGSSVHDGQYVRRDLIMGEWKAKRRSIAFDGVEIVGWRTRSPQVTAGAGLYFEVAVKLTRPASGPIDLLLFAHGPEGAVESWSLPLGYGLYPPTEWEASDTFVGKWPLRLHRDLPEGSYRLSVAVLSDGEIAMPVVPQAGLARVNLGPALRLVPKDEMTQAAADDLDAMHEHVHERACFSAELAWEDAVAHRIRSREWQDYYEPEARGALATCWGNRAGRKANRLRDTEPTLPKGETVETLDEMLEKAAWEIERGRTWDPTEERLTINAQRVATQLEARSRTLEHQGKDQQAFEALALAARVDPSRPFLRRRVERWRARRLGFEDRLGPLPP